MKRPLIHTLLAIVACNVVVASTYAERLPYNPYHGRQETPQRPKSQRTPVRSPPRIHPVYFDRSQYPDGPYGRRILRVVVTRDDLDINEMKRVLISEEQRIRYELQQLDWVPMTGQEIDYRLYAHAVWEEMSRLMKTRDIALAKLRDNHNVQRQVELGLNTVVIWNVRNHRNRTYYVPNTYLERKAIAYVQHNPSVMGQTIYLDF